MATPAQRHARPENREAIDEAEAQGAPVSHQYVRHGSDGGAEFSLRLLLDKLLEAAKPRDSAGAQGLLAKDTPIIT